MQRLVHSPIFHSVLCRDKHPGCIYEQGVVVVDWLHPGNPPPLFLLHFLFSSILIVPRHDRSFILLIFGLLLGFAGSFILLHLVP